MAEFGAEIQFDVIATSIRASAAFRPLAPFLMPRRYHISHSYSMRVAPDALS